MLALRVDDHAVEGGGELEVAHPGLDPLRLTHGHRQVGAGDLDVDLRLRQRGLSGEQVGFRPRDGRLGASRAAVLDFNWFVDSSRTWGSTTPRLTSFCSRLTSESQRSTMASNLSRIALASARLALADLTLASATFTTLRASSIRCLSSSTVAFLVPKSSTNSGTNSVASVSPFFTLSPMSTFHFSM